MNEHFSIRDKWRLVLFLAILAGSMMALFCSNVLAQSNRNHDRLNILFIAIDDLRPELGCYGNKYIKTTNVDRLAEQGVVFTRAYCQQAVCNPPRASLLTGLRPDSTKVWDLVTDWRPCSLRQLVSRHQIHKRGHLRRGIRDARMFFIVQRFQFSFLCPIRGMGEKKIKGKIRYFSMNTAGFHECDDMASTSSIVLGIFLPNTL